MTTNTYIVSVDYKQTANQITWRAYSYEGKGFTGESPELAVGQLFKAMDAARQCIPARWLELPTEKIGALVMKEQEQIPNFTKGPRGITILLKGLAPPE